MPRMKSSVEKKFDEVKREQLGYNWQAPSAWEWLAWTAQNLPCNFKDSFGSGTWDEEQDTKLQSSPLDFGKHRFWLLSKLRKVKKITAKRGGGKGGEAQVPEPPAPAEPSGAEPPMKRRRKKGN